MLIRRAQIDFRDIVDVRLRDGAVAEVGARLEPAPGEPCTDARGSALLPGLHDHHIHLASFAASLESVACGPPAVGHAHALTDALRHADRHLARGAWIRGVGYHDSVAGPIDRDWLDERVRDRPVRIQHRSGRLWILNSAALDALAAGADAPLERAGGRATGRLYDADNWLRPRLRGARPSLTAASARLAASGITGVTDTTPANGPGDFRHFADAQRRGELLQSVLVMGDDSLHGVEGAGALQVGARKWHLHDADLPEFDGVCAGVRRCHESGRPAAFHCVTRADLAFALAVLRDAGSHAGDRIEHAAVAPPDLAGQIAAARVCVVTQPGFIGERGDAYAREVEAADRPWLYRLRGLLDAGVPLAGSSDAPFGDADPWRAMQHAVERRSAGGQVLGADEALTPEQAVGLYLGPAGSPGRGRRRVAVGESADLCLLATPWAVARADLAAVRVRTAWIGGRVVAQAAGTPAASTPTVGGRRAAVLGG